VLFLFLDLFGNDCAQKKLCKFIFWAIFFTYENAVFLAFCMVLQYFYVCTALWPMYCANINQ